VLLDTANQKSDAINERALSLLAVADTVRALGRASARIARQQGLSAAVNFWSKAHRDPRALATWIDFITRHAAAHGAAPDARELRKPQRNYGRAHRNVAARVRSLITHHRFSAHHLPLNFYRALLNGQPVRLAGMVGRKGIYTISLASSLRHEQKQEGELTLFVSDAEGRALARMAFSFDCDNCGHPQLLIGGLQGLAAGIDKSVIVQATRDLSGLRPKDASLVAVHALAQALGIDQVLAVSQATHVLSTEWAFSRSFISRDYDGFWRDRGGIEAPGIGYVMPRHDYAARIAGKATPRKVDALRAALATDVATTLATAQ
jgi:uncharacterized protein